MQTAVTKQILYIITANGSLNLAVQTNFVVLNFAVIFRFSTNLICFNLKK